MVSGAAFVPSSAMSANHFACLAPAQTMLPDAGNEAAFPAPVLRPGQEYRNQVVWRFYQV